ncbi:10304_t:CDS:2, partial [Scutellospora calospora]
INDESEAIAKKTNSRIDMHLATTSALIFAERYEGEANQYDLNSMYIFEMIKKDASWPIALATIERNLPKKSLQCTRYLCYNLHRIYTYYDLEYAQKNGLKSNILYKIKKEGGIEGKVTSAQKRISEIVKPLEDQVKHIHTDSFIIARKIEFKTGIEIEIPNLIIFKENELRSTNSLLDFEKIQQDKKQNTILDTEYPALQTAKRKLSKKSDINLPNEIIIEIFQHL